MDYKKLKIAELRQLAEEKGLRGMSGLKKAELVELLENVDKMHGAKSEAEASADTSAVKRNVPTSDETASASQENVPTSDESSKSSNKLRAAKSGSVSKKSNKSTESRDNNSKDNKSHENNSQDKKSRDNNSQENKSRVKKSQDNQHDKTIAQNQAARREDSDTDSGKKNEKVQKQQDEEKYAAQMQDEDYYSGAALAHNKEQDDEEENVPSDKDDVAEGILEVMSDGFGFIRSDNYMPGDKDIYVSPSQIRKFRLRTGDIVRGPIRRKLNPNEKFNALLYINSVNGYSPNEILKRKKFEDMTPIFPNERIHLDYTGAPVSLRIVDLFSPIGKGQRGMIVSPPKAGKTTLLKQIAKRISVANPEMNLLVLLIDERPEEVTDIKESIEGPNAEVIYSTFDELPEHHKRVSEMVIERAKRLVESGQDVVILIDSITRLSRAYNLTVPPSGRTLSGGLDPAALHMPKKFFGAARNMREGGSLTILATALIDTGSRMDDVVFEEFKGTGNMELVLDRNLQEKRVFPAIDISKSGTRKDNLLLTKDEQEVLSLIHSRFHSLKVEDVTEDLIKLFNQTKNNEQFIGVARKLFQPKRP